MNAPLSTRSTSRLPHVHLLRNYLTQELLPPTSMVLSVVSCLAKPWKRSPMYMTSRATCRCWNFKKSSSRAGLSVQVMGRGHTQALGDFPINAGSPHDRMGDHAPLRRFLCLVPDSDPSACMGAASAPGCCRDDVVSPASVWQSKPSRPLLLRIALMSLASSSRLSARVSGALLIRDWLDLARSLRRFNKLSDIEDPAISTVSGESTAAAA